MFIKTFLPKMKTAGRSAAVRGSSTKQNVRYMQQPSWLQSAPPYNVHSVHLLIVQSIILSILNLPVGGYFFVSNNWILRVLEVPAR